MLCYGCNGIYSESGIFLRESEVIYSRWGLNSQRIGFDLQRMRFCFVANAGIHSESDLIYSESQ